MAPPPWLPLLALLPAAGAGLLPEDAGCAMSFRGNQEVQLLREGGKIFDFVLAFTMESWTRSGDFEGGSEMCIHGFATMGSGPRLSLLNAARGPCASGACPYGAYTITAPSVMEEFMCMTPVPDREWHHIAATWDNRTAKLYVDGREACSYEPPQSAFNFELARKPLLSQTAYSIGALPDHYRFLKGEVDEVRLWKVVRSGAEILAWMHRHLDATQRVGLEVELRFDECGGQWTRNHGPLADTGELLRGSVGIRLQPGIVGINSAPGWVASRALLFGADGDSRADVRAGGAWAWDVPLRALDVARNAVVRGKVAVLATLADGGGIEVSAGGEGLRLAASAAPSNVVEGGEALLNRRLLLGRRTVEYRLEASAGNVTGRAVVTVVGNRLPMLGESGRSISFKEGAYATSLGFRLAHRGTEGRSGKGHSAKVTVELWSRNSLSGLLKAGGARTAAFSLGNSDGAGARCAASCTGRATGHLPMSATEPSVGFLYGVGNVTAACAWSRHSGEWQHVAFVADPDAGFVRTYVNGELCGSGVFAGGPTGDLRGFVLGGWPLTESYAHHTGEVDEMRVWSKARTAAEIAEAMFRAPTAQELASKELLASWSFDDCGTAESNVCRDATGKGNDLVFAGCGESKEWSGLFGACLNLTHPLEAHSASWPGRQNSLAPIKGPFAAIKPRTMEEELSRRLEQVVITAVDPDADDTLELEFMELPEASVGTFYVQERRLVKGSVVPMQRARPLVHSVTLRVEGLGLAAGALGELVVRAKDTSGTLSDVARIPLQSRRTGPGQEFVERLGRSQPCPKGYFNNGTGTACQKCPRGSFGPLPQSWHESVSNVACAPCSPGKFGFESGLAHCVDCELGRFSSGNGSTTCANCPYGTYTDLAGASACKPCLLGTTTLIPGATGPDHCLCPMGQFMPCAEGPLHSNLSMCSIELQPPAGVCRRCQEGMLCRGGAEDCPKSGEVSFTCPMGRLHAQPLLLPSYYHDRRQPLNVFRCWNRGSCPGQEKLGDAVCAEGHEAVNCGRCQPGRFRSTGGSREASCKECQPGVVWLWLVLLLLAWLAFGLALHLRHLLDGSPKRTRTEDLQLTPVIPVDDHACCPMPPEQPAAVLDLPGCMAAEAEGHETLASTLDSAEAEAGTADCLTPIDVEEPLMQDESFTEQDDFVPPAVKAQHFALVDAAPVASVAQHLNNTERTGGTPLNKASKVPPAASLEESVVVARSQFVHASLFASCMGTGLSFLQRLAVLDLLNFDWPESLRRILGYCSALLLDVSWGSLNANCVFGSSFEAVYLGHLSVPTSIWLMGGSWYLLNVLAGRRFPGLRLASILSVLGMLTLTFYTLILVVTVALVDCYGNPNGLSTLRRFPYIICGDAEQHRMLPVFAFATLVYLVGFMAFCLFLLKEAPRRYTEPDFRRVVSFLTFKYRPGCYWYSLVVATRSLGLSLVTVVAPQSALLQFWIMSGCLLASLVMQLSWSPMRNRVCHWLEVTEQSTLLGVLALGVSFRAREQDLQAFAVPVERLIVASVLGYVLLLCSLGAHVLLSQVLWPERVLASRNRELQEALRQLQISAGLVLADSAAARTAFAEAAYGDVLAVQRSADFWLLELRGLLRRESCLRQRLPLSAASVKSCDEDALARLRGSLLEAKAAPPQKP